MVPMLLAIPETPPLFAMACDACSFMSFARLKSPMSPSFRLLEATVRERRGHRQGGKPASWRGESPGAVRRLTRRRGAADAEGAPRPRAGGAGVDGSPAGVADAVGPLVDFRERPLARVEP